MIKQLINLMRLKVDMLLSLDAWMMFFQQGFEDKIIIYKKLPNVPITTWTLPVFQGNNQQVQAMINNCPF